MIQFLPAILALAKEIPAVKRLMEKVPEPMQEIAASVLTTKLASAGVDMNNLIGNGSETVAIESVISASEEDILAYCQQNMGEARSMYTHDNGSREQADRMAENIMRWNLLYICLFIIALILTVAYVTDSGAIGIISAAIGAALNQLYNERNTVMGFYYASMDGVQKLLSGPKRK